MPSKMTEKSMKSLKNKKQHLKLKKPNAQQPQPSKVFESGSDISEPEDGTPRPKMDHKALNKISSEVTDLLATLKKEHGIDNDADGDDDGPEAKPSPVKKEKKKLVDQPKSNNNNNKQQQKKRPANTENALVSEVKKLKVEGKAAKQPQQQQQAKSKKANANQKVKPTNQTIAVKMELDDTNDDVAQETPSKKKNKKKQKNKKRPAETAAAANDNDDDDENDDSDDDDTNAAPPQAKKAKTAPVQNQKQNQKQKQKQKSNEKKAALNGDDAGEEDSQQESGVKKEHHLKNAVPVYVGNLPNNIKRLKLLKLFKKFGNVLAIRFRSNSGMSIFKTSQLKKAPFIIAFVYLDTREAAEASLALNGTQIGDNVIVVDLDGNKREKIKQAQPNTVVVGNLKYAVTEQILRQAFKCCGEIDHIRTLQGPEGCKGIAFVQFAKPESCELALKLHGTEILDREIRVSRYSIKKKEKAQPNAKKGKQQKGGKGQKNAAKGGAKPKAGDDDADVAMHKIMQAKKKKNKAVKEFMGTKSVDNKKVSNQKNKKKKNKMSAEKLMAKKVAPKVEKAA